MNEIVKVADWESFKTLERLHFEVDSYIHILDFLIENERVEQSTFKYYEDKYLKAHIDYYFAKKAFEKDLQIHLKTDTFKWEVDFEKKEVKAFD